MRILFVAPRSELETGQELARVASGNEISVVDGAVDRSKLEFALRDGNFDVVHFAQHGDRSGLQMTDGILEVADLVSMLEHQQRLRLFVVNACESVATGIALHNAFHVPVVAHDAAITDGAAVAFAETFYRALRTTEIGVAYQRALRTLQVRFPNDARTPQLLNGDMADKACMEKMRTEMHDAFAQVNQRLDALEGKMDMLDGERSRHAQVMITVLLAALLIAQLLTPVMNRWMMP